MKIKAAFCLNASLIAMLFAGQTGAEAVRETAREIPVIDTVDVIVVGGSSAGAAAAVSAAGAGAKVFLAAERPYIGEDICGTYRLWLNPGEIPVTPLEKTVFENNAAQSKPESLTFSYKADMSSTSHVDTEPGTLLNDGKTAGANVGSVQFNGDVNIVLDLKEARDFTRVGLYAYRKAGSYGTGEVSFYSRSKESQDWKLLGTVSSKDAASGAQTFDLAAAGRDRFIKLSVKKDQGLNRNILGEIYVTETAPAAPAPLRPMQVKLALSKALTAAGVNFLFGSMVTDILADEKGNPAGVIIANRSGRQAVLGKVIVDATPRSVAARLAGAQFTPYPSGTRTVQYITIGDYEKKGPGILDVKELPPLSEDGSGHRAHLYTLAVDMPDDTLYSFSRAEQKVRDLTWDKQLVDSANRFFEVPPDHVVSQGGAAGVWPGCAQVAESAFRPEGVSRLFVLNGCADISRDAAASMLRPLEYFRTGGRIGLLAAQEAQKTVLSKTVNRKTNQQKDAVAADIRERLTGLRELPATGASYVRVGEGVLPVFGKADVVVVGGGTGGAPAGIGAVRGGAKTIVLDYLYGLGGTGTDGMVSSYFGGYRGGFTAELDKLTDDLTGVKPVKPTCWNIEAKKEAYRRMLQYDGGEIIFGVIGCGVVMSGDRVCGVVVTTPSHGRGVILADAVVDGTGGSEMAVAAGAAYDFIDAKVPALQGTGFPAFRNLPTRRSYWFFNNDWTFTDDMDALDVKRTFLLGAEFAAEEYDMAQIIQTRERRRIAGEKTVTPVDILSGRTYSDTVAYATSSFDSHGFMTHPLFSLMPPEHIKHPVWIPYGALIPQKIDGILVVGLGMSVHRDSVPTIRMQSDVQNLGYAAGYAASMAAAGGGHTRGIDLPALQKYLTGVGMFPEPIKFAESQPFNPAQMAKAVDELCKKPADCNKIAAVLTQPEAALPLLREAYGRSSLPESSRLWIARILGMYGDNTGVKTLVDELDRAAVWDKGWNFKVYGQYGGSRSELDSLVLSAGYTRDPRVLPSLLRLAGLLDEKSELSHIMAISGALESIGDPQAAPVLAALLNKPGMKGYAVSDMVQSTGKREQMKVDKNMTREKPLKELFLARALYRLGDQNGLARGVLEDYSRDLLSLYATHAALVLKSPAGSMLR